MSQADMNLDKDIDSIIKGLLKTKGKPIHAITQDMQLRDFFDYVELRILSFKIDAGFKIDSHAFIDDIVTIADLHSVVKTLIYEKYYEAEKKIEEYKNVNTNISKILTEICKPAFNDILTMSPYINLLDVMDSDQIKKIVCRIEEKYKIDIKAHTNEISTIADLYNVIAVLLYEKNVNKIKTVFTDFFKSIQKNVSEITPDTKLRDILGYVELRRLFFRIDADFKINSYPLINDVATVKDLSLIMSMLLSENVVSEQQTEQHVSTKEDKESVEVLERASSLYHNKPWLIIISGPNGAGKTTFHDGFLEENPFLKGALFANSDIEFARLMSLPENQTIYQELTYNIKQTAEEIRKNLLKKFSKTVSAVSSNIAERMEKSNREEVGEYWKEQYSLFIHVPQDQEYIIEGLSSKKDLMYRVSSADVHERINSKNAKNSWYKTYKRFINTIEVQEAIYLKPLQDKLNGFDMRMQRVAGETVLKKVYAAFEKGENMVFETTGSGNMVHKFAYQAKTKYNYNVFSFHPYVLHPKLSIARVQQRVAKGGHNVPTDVILQRYAKSLNALPKVLSEVDVGIVMDNSGEKRYIPIFAQINGNIVDFAQCPEYLQPVRTEMVEKMPQESLKDLLHLQQDMDMSKMTEEQREIFGQTIVTKLFGQIR